MLTKLATLLLAVLLTTTSSAQHCPFDGARLIAVKLVDAKGKILNPKNYTAWLVEVDNPVADSCTYATGLLKKNLLDKNDFFKECDTVYHAYSKALKDRLKQKGVIAKANLFIMINQPETNCMIIRDGVFVYRKRKFVVMVEHGSKIIRVPVREDAIGSLCTANKELENLEVVSFRF